MLSFDIILEANIQNPLAISYRSLQFLEGKKKKIIIGSFCDGNYS